MGVNKQELLTYFHELSKVIIFSFGVYAFCLMIICTFSKPAETFLCRKFMACNKDALVGKLPYHTLINGISYSTTGIAYGVSPYPSLSISPSSSAEFEG